MVMDGGREADGLGVDVDVWGVLMLSVVGGKAEGWFIAL